MQPAGVLFANDIFYVAFSNRDFEAMENLWSRAHPVICIHPGWTALTNRKAIIESWKNILENPESPLIKPHHARVFPHGNFASVVCYEEVRESMLVATNIFVEENGEIRILHHQAAPCSNPPKPEAPKKVDIQ